MITRMTLIAAFISFGFAGPLVAADNMSKDQVKAERDRISTDAKAAKDRCKDMKGNEKDICMAEAKGQEKVAKAELDAKQKNTPKARQNVALAKADMEYSVAKEKCDDMKGKEKNACEKEAKNTHKQSKDQVKAART